MMGIDIAIAIVTYRSANLTIDCLSSIEAERSTQGVNIRAIVVDNVSGDAKLVAKTIDQHGWWSWVTLITAPKNGGFAYGNNLALQRANADGPPKYLHMLNPDTVVRKGAIGELVRFLEAHPDIGIAGSSFETLDGSEWPKAFRFPSLLSEFEEGLQFGLASRVLRRWVVAQLMTPVPQPIDWVVGASMMIRWSVLDRIGGFDDNYFLYFEETDFCLRAKKAGLSTWYVPASRVMHIGGQSTNVSNRKAVPERLPAYWFRVAAQILCRQPWRRLRNDRRWRGVVGARVRVSQAHGTGAQRSGCSTLSRRLAATQRVVAKKQTSSVRYSRDAARTSNA